jgi:hypothetical protein
MSLVVAHLDQLGRSNFLIVTGGKADIERGRRSTRPAVNDPKRTPRTCPELTSADASRAFSDRRRRRQKRERGISIYERIGETVDELDQISLAVGACLFKNIPKVSPDGRCGDAEYLGDFWHATNFGDGKQDAELRHRQLIGLRDNFR